MHFPLFPLEGLCHVQCYWEESTHILSWELQAKSSMSVTSYGFIIWADAHLLFSGTHSGSAGAVFVPLSQGGDKDRWAPRLSGIRKVLFAQGLHFLSALDNFRAVVIPAGISGKEEQSPGTLASCSAGVQTTAATFLVVFFTENYRHFFGINPN